MALPSRHMSSASAKPPCACTCAVIAIPAVSNTANNACFIVAILPDIINFPVVNVLFALLASVVLPDANDSLIFL